MKSLKLKTLFLPAFLIVAIIGILLLFIASSTRKNLDRDKRHLIESAQYSGRAILYATRIFIQAHGDETRDFKDQLERFVLKTKKKFRASYLYVKNSDGSLLAGDPGKTAGGEIFSISPDESTDSLDPVTNIYEIVMAITFEKNLNNVETLYMVLGLDMKKLGEAIESDLFHAYIMGSILLILGLGVFFFLYVIHNYYRVDHTLKETMDYTDIVVENMANGLISIDRQGIVTTLNSLAAELLGLDFMDAQGKNLSLFLNFKRCGIEETLNNQSSILDLEIEFSGKKGGKIPLSLSVSPIPGDKNSCMGAVIVLRDLTGIKELEARLRLSEKLAAVGEFAAGVAHEIRNPLSSIRGFAKFLSNTFRGMPREREYIEIIIKEVDRINQVVGALLDFSRPITPETGPVDMKRLIGHVAALVEKDLTKHHIKLTIDIEKETSTLLIDENLFTQVFLNLMLNAVAAIDEKGRLSISVTPHPDPGICSIKVEDDGKGIPGEDLDRIFDPFFTTGEGGTGLGLSVTHGIVKAHGGKINAFSPPPGKSTGCLIEIFIPFEESR